jgi:hypothetical protein
MPMRKKADPDRFCQSCGNRLTRKRFGVRLEDRNCFLRRVYCNQDCMACGYVKDTSQPGSKRRRVTKYRGTSCESCGATTNLHAHHVDENLDNDSPENIQTLCGPCHNSHHHRARRAGKTVAGRMESNGLSPE